jgi:polyhydroxyalkanoate synthesis repressor PhaR
VIRLVKRYGSRKLYDTEESRYVSLDDLATWVRDGQEIRVVDNATSEDVTSQTLSQVILEQSRSGKDVPPSELLHELIRRGGDFVTTGVDRLLQAGLDRLGPVRAAREETAVLRRRLEELEATLQNLERTDGAPGATVAEVESDSTDRDATES